MTLAQITTDIDGLVRVVDSGPLAVLGLVLLLVVLGGVIVIYNNTGVNRQLIKLMSDQNASNSRLKDSIDRNSTVIEQLSNTQQAASAAAEQHRQDEAVNRNTLTDIIERNTAAIEAVSHNLTSHDHNAVGFIHRQTEATEAMQEQMQGVMSLLMEIKRDIEEDKQQRQRERQQDAERLQAVIEQLMNVVDKLTAIRDDKDEE